jgi:hypothetical protein
LHHFPFYKRVLFFAKSLDGLMTFKVSIMRRLFAVSACAAAVLVASATARAVEMPGLYQAEVPVTGQSAAERESASRTALEEVLVKVSGNADVAQLPQLESLLSHAEQWVQRYQYRSAPPPPAAAQPATAVPAAPVTETPPAADSPLADAAPAPTQLLWESFDRQTINQHLYDAGVSVWGGNRPATLLWLAIGDGGARYLVGGDNRPDMQAMVNSEARRRGLPLNVPLLDLQDQGALAVADVWGDFFDMIFKASERYQPDAILVGRVYAVAGDQWQSHWTLYDSGNAASWESGQGTQQAAIKAGVAGAADRFAKRYALELTPGITNTVLISIENVATLADYARVTHYLQTLDPVAAVQVERVEGPRVSFRIKVRGQPHGLIQTIALGKTLVAAQPASDDAPMTPAAAGGDGDGASLAEEYRYRIAP